MTNSDGHIKKAFAEESLEHLSSIEEDLIRIENGDLGKERERVNKVFRAVHSIKGGSGFLGIGTITRLAHAMETVLGHIREGTLDPNAEVIHFLLQGSDVLTHLIQYMDHSDKFDISEPVAALESICPSPRNHPDVHSASPDTPLTMVRIRFLKHHQIPKFAARKPAMTRIRWLWLPGTGHRCLFWKSGFSCDRKRKQPGVSD